MSESGAADREAVPRTEPSSVSPAPAAPEQVTGGAASVFGDGFSPSTVLALQKTAGNCAVSRYLGRSTGVTGPRCACGGIPGADGECAACKAKRLALEQDGAHTAAPIAVQRSPQLLRAPCACGGVAGPDGECAECRAKRLAAAGPDDLTATGL